MKISFKFIQSSSGVKLIKEKFWNKNEIFRKKIIPKENFLRDIFLCNSFKRRDDGKNGSMLNWSFKKNLRKFPDPLYKKLKSKNQKTLMLNPNGRSEPNKPEQTKDRFLNSSETN